MACYYYLKLPTGGVIRISASLGNFSEIQLTTLRGLIDNYKKNSPNSNIELDSFLINNTQLTPENVQDLVNTITIDNAQLSDTDWDDFKNIFIETLAAKTSNTNIADMIRLAVFNKKSDNIQELKNEVWFDIDLETLLTTLKIPITDNYFNNIDASEIVGGDIAYNVKQDLTLKQARLDSLNLDSSLLKDTQILLQHSFPQTVYNRNVQNFFKVRFSQYSKLGLNDSVLVFDDALEQPLVFYNADSDVSLHFALAKLVLINYLKDDSNVLKTLLTEFNTDPRNNGFIINADSTIQEFLNGTIDSNGDRLSPEIYNLFKTASGIDILMKLIIAASDKISDIDTRTKVIKAITSAIQFLDLTQPEKKRKYISEEAHVRQQLQSEKSGLEEVVNLFTQNNRKLYYNIAATSEKFESANDLFNFLNATIIKGEDIIKVDIYDRIKQKNVLTRYITPTYWRVVEGGIFLRGWYENANVLSKFEGIIPSGQTITYSKLASKVTPENYTQNVFSKLEKPIILINDPNSPMSPEFLLSVLKRGSVVKYKGGKEEFTRSVKNVYPGGIEVNSDGIKPFSPKLTSITEIQLDPKTFDLPIIETLLSEKPELNINDFLIGRSLEIVKKLQKEEPNVPIFPEDWVSSGTKGKEIYNLVVGTSNDAVYIMVQSVNGTKILPIKKSKILNVYKVPATLDEKIFHDIAAFYTSFEEGKSLRNYNFSMATDYNKLQNGDYIWSNANATLYKIINKENKDLVEININIKAGSDTNTLSTKYVSEFPSDVIYLTEKHVASEHYLKTIEANNFHLQAGQNKDISTQDRKQYYVPENVELTEDMLLGSGNLSIGYVGIKPEIGFKDVTQELIKLIDARDNSPILHNILGVVSYKNYIERYDKNLYKSVYSGEKEKFLQEHSYISLRGSAHKYRILSRDGNKLLLEYNVFNKYGKVLTINKYFNINEEGSKIDYLYLMLGNSKEKELESIDAKEKMKKPSEMSNTELFNGIVDAFQNLFEIEINFINEVDNELKNKRAWISSSSEQNSININVNNTDNKKEVVHEYLHLFLMAAKYDNKTLYETLLINYAKTKGIDLNSINLNEVEELFVDAVNKIMWENPSDPSDLSSIDGKSFLSLFKNIMVKLDVVEEEDGLLKEYEGVAVQELFEILNKDMKEIRGFNKKSNKENANLILFDLNFKNWMTNLIDRKSGNNTLIINCE